ncbi:hypothetical protein LNTAR_02999 [Lentisphaera araneosa HTCC2155]|uniref:Band 7 domain-containing protein n=1 Tax=Lentisphaera araneosa HTCC2155 TaxID=313628 RepID=A6DTT0_9BACT|nr:SPFH domain-containing protein [Lentisphaera araneosa]EDM24951.1 hypothetical protein LNTAR_02999 [Lentisphaera araneosa HTCC2155]
MTYKRQQKLAILSTIACFFMAAVFGLLITKLPESAHGHILQAGIALLASAFISLLSYFHAGSCQKALVEKQDMEDRPPEENIFGDDEGLTLTPGQNNLESFRKIIIPTFLIAISALEFATAISFFNLSIPENLKLPEQGSNPFLLCSFILFGITFIFFATGKYFSGLAFGENLSLLRPACGRLLYCSFISLIAGISSLLANYGHFQWIDISSRFIASLAIILASERILLWILDLYRPREANEGEALVYESRLLSIFSRPSGFIGNLSDVLEYQFGFRISEQIIKKFVFRILTPFACLQVILLIVFSSITYIAPGYKAILSGSGTSSTLEPGLHITPPYPFSQITRVETSRLRQINFTMGKDIRTEQEKEKRPFLDTKSWINTDYQSSLFLTGTGTGSRNAEITVFNAQINYQVKSDEIALWAAHENPEQQLVALARNTLTFELMRSNFTNLYQIPRSELENILLKSLTQALEKYQLNIGVKLESIDILNFQPHPAIAEAWNEKLAAVEFSKLTLDKAGTYAKTTEFDALSARSTIENESSADYYMNSELTKADRDIFETRLKAFKEYKELYTQFALIEILSKHLSSVRKVVFTTEQEKIAELDLKRPQPNILDITE